MHPTTLLYTWSGMSTHRDIYKCLTFVVFRVVKIPKNGSFQIHIKSYLPRPFGTADMDCPLVVIDALIHCIFCLLSLS